MKISRLVSATSLAKIFQLDLKPNLLLQPVRLGRDERSSCKFGKMSGLERERERVIYVSA